ncbi:CLUMA_CG007151, isoform A [Clunio marinus]|uniref:CLUMA_CG007151, isoform A n=1 Tax=Clunio marinus TaxID=568069 RepID=A0A1J1I021_9DIPT|nr:CLUMA_CG007151, isoform A [Clunio marinus]
MKTLQRNQIKLTSWFATLFHSFQFLCQMSELKKMTLDSKLYKNYRHLTTPNLCKHINHMNNV